MSERLTVALARWEEAPAAARRGTPLTGDFGYEIDSIREGRRQAARSSEAVAEAQDAGDSGDRYSLVTVLLAAALFVLGISTTFRIPRIRLLTMGLGVALLVVALSSMLTLPIQNPNL